MADATLDHLMIAVRDLDHAIARYRSLGFEVRAGGVHEALGTRNAIIAFEDRRYLELITIVDEERARRNLAEGDRFVELALGHREIPMIVVLRSADLAAVQSGFASAGVGLAGPDHMSRREPSGRMVTFSVLRPQVGSWRLGLPSVIDWGLASHPAERAGAHPNGARRLHRLTLVVAALAEHELLYRALGFDLVADGSGVQAYREGVTMAFADPATDRQTVAVLAAHGAGVTSIEIESLGPFTIPSAHDRPFSIVASSAGPLSNP